MLDDLKRWHDSSKIFRTFFLLLETLTIYNEKEENIVYGLRLKGFEHFPSTYIKVINDSP